MVRKIIKINDEKCNGCGLCADACHEGAIQMVNGKAKLTREDYCDGLGDCLPACPAEAISFEEREAPAYDHAAVLASKADKAKPEEPLPCSCPGTQSKTLARARREEPAVGRNDRQRTDPMARTDQARAGERAVFQQRPSADCGRLYGLCLRGLSPQIYLQSRDADRLPEARYGRLYRKADRNHPPEQYQKRQGRPYGSALLRRDRSGCYEGASGQRKFIPWSVEVISTDGRVIAS